MIKIIVKMAIAALIANASWRVGSAYLTYCRFKDAVEETEVLEIGHRSMKQLFQTNPELVESLSRVIAERRAALAATAATRTVEEESEGLISSIRRFFGLG